MSERKKKPLILIVVVLFLAIFAIAAYFFYRPLPGQNAPGNDIYAEDFNNTAIPINLFEQDLIAQEYYTNPQYNSLTGDYRPRWAGCTDEQFVQIFGKLPKMPQDFYKKYKYFMDGMFTDYERLGPEYWKQPEFYGLNQDFFTKYTRPVDDNMWYIGQISARPAIRLLEIKAGYSVNLSLFFYTSIIGSEAYLGGIIYPVFPEHAMAQTGTVIYDNPPDAQDHIKARITGPVNDPLYESTFFQMHIQGKSNVQSGERILLFPATYTKTDYKGKTILGGFPENWCYKVSFEVDVLPGTPKGNYVVAIDAKNPNSALIEEYNWEISGDPYYSFYYEAIRETRPITPFFQLLITVVE